MQAKNVFVIVSDGKSRKTRKKMLDSYNLFPNIHLGFDNKITLHGVPSVSEGSHTGAIFFIITDNVKNRKFNV